MKRWYTVTYITDGRYQSVVEWEGFAEDSGEAIDNAHYDDYYLGKIISVNYDEREED